MKKTFQYRIYPSRKQETILRQTLGGCQKVYNLFLEQRNAAYKEKGESLSCYDQSKTLVGLKKELPVLKDIHSQVLQNISTRVDLAYQSFFRREIGRASCRERV